MTFAWKPGLRHGLKHCLRAGFLGFIAMFTVGAMILADQVKGSRDRVIAELQLEDQESVADGSATARTPNELREIALDRIAKRGFTDLFSIGIIGALTAIASVGLLWWFFPVGPASKIVIGTVCGPFVPLVLFLDEHLRQGKAGDLAGIVVIGMLVGALAGVLEANRVLQERRNPAAPSPSP